MKLTEEQEQIMTHMAWVKHAARGDVINALIDYKSIVEASMGARSPKATEMGLTRVHAFEDAIAILKKAWDL